MRKFLLLIAFALSVFMASAQSNEVYISVNPTTFHADGADGFSPLGLSAGYNRFIDLGCNDALKLVIGGKLNYAWKSVKHADWSFMRVTVPVNIGYRFKAGELGIMPYAGLDLTLYPLAQIKAEGETASLFDEDEVTELLKANRFQAGWQIGADFDFKNVVFGFAYQSDLTKFQDNTVYPVKVKTFFSEFEIKLGYRF